MATSGIGRGRGWLNLNKENKNKPGNPPNPHVNSNDLQSPKPIKSCTPSVQQYVNLVSMISQISSTDDGILLNQKLKAVIELWGKDCSTSNEVEESLSYIYNKCLEDEVFALKVVIMVSSYTFITTTISDQKIRRLFIGHIQNTYENCKQLQLNNPNKFRTAVRILSEYFNKARLIDGRPITLLVTPLLCYFDMLLDSAQPADLELFTTQLYLNGSAIKNDYQQQLNDLINKVRKVLISNGALTKISKLYLLLAIEIASNRYSLLPADVNSFYQDQLGEQAMAQFQGALGALSIQTQQTNKTLDSYQSNVNVLQVSPPEPSSPISEQQQQQQPTTNAHTMYVNQNFAPKAYKTNEPPLNFGTWDDRKDKPNNNRSEKTGRPILGSGARLKKDKHDGTSNWRDTNKDPSGQWSEKSGTHWREKKPPPKTYNKGWEHDDRFSNDYS